MEENCLYELIKECLKKEYTSIGKQEGIGEEYNCKICNTTISEENIVNHYVNNHYAEGIKKIRNYRNETKN